MLRLNIRHDRLELVQLQPDCENITDSNFIDSFATRAINPVLTGRAKLTDACQQSTDRARRFMTDGPAD